MPDRSLSRYADELLGGEDELLRTLREDAGRRGMPQIQAPVELARLLQLLILQTGAQRVLEIGTLFGYTAIAMAQVLPPGGKVITLELDPERAELSRRNAERAQVAGRVEVRAGVATEALSALAERSFDLTFIDADKASYPEYLAWALKLTRPRGFIVADNVWRAGSVLDPDPNDVGTQALAEFNRELAVQPRLFTTFIANRDCADAASVSLVRE